jgi:hypothetical protein
VAGGAATATPPRRWVREARPSFLPLRERAAALTLVGAQRPKLAGLAHTAERATDAHDALQHAVALHALAPFLRANGSVLEQNTECGTEHGRKDRDHVASTVDDAGLQPEIRPPPVLFLLPLQKRAVRVTSAHRTVANA